jgi:hypothetical protein
MLLKVVGSRLILISAAIEVNGLSLVFLYIILRLGGLLHGFQLVCRLYFISIPALLKLLDLSYLFQTL